MLGYCIVEDAVTKFQAPSGFRKQDLIQNILTFFFAAVSHNSNGLDMSVIFFFTLQSMGSRKILPRPKLQCFQKKYTSEF